ncbi:MAG: hypothetical protein JWL83_3055 [Actinomycetia bacterium]|jgi:quercetin dioxygenase-like cupin family protein|nr:hypothetical protein [Actinomycetes bacterium]
MTDDRDRDLDQVSFVDGHCPPAFERRVITVAPGQAHAYDDAEWRDAIVVVQRGDIELEGVSGRRYGIAPGDILWLADMPLRALHNVGTAPAVFIAVSRRKWPEDGRFNSA